MKGNIGRIILISVIIGVAVAAMEFILDLCLDINTDRFDVVFIVLAVLLGNQLGWFSGRKK